MVRYVADIVPRDAAVLEVAAGTADISIALSEKAKTILCTDLSEKMLNVAKRKAKTQTNIRFDIRGIYDLKEPNDAYDVVVASQVLHLLDEPEVAVRELKRVTRDYIIAPLALIKDLRGFQKLKVGLWKIFGFNPIVNLDLEGCKAFLREIGLDNCEIELIDGDMPMAVAVWRKRG